MTGFEVWIAGVGNEPSTIYARTIAQIEPGCPLLAIKTREI